jgi:nitrate reductase gamma subunit
MASTDILWSLISLFVTGLAYFAGLVLVLGLAAALLRFLRTPAPLPVALTPAPSSEGGAVLRVLGDVTLFPALFKADKWLWAGTIVFHGALFTILFRHMRYFTFPVPQAVLLLEPVALAAGYIFGLSALYLFWRRLALPRALYISGLPDYFALVLLGGIASTGILVSYWLHVNLLEVKAYVLGLLTLHPVAPPQHPLFLVHLTLVLLLMIYFPFSKLLHSGGIFFSPTLTQPFQVQQTGKRYVNPWDKSPRQ